MEGTFVYGLLAVLQFVGADTIAIQKEGTHRIARH